MEEVVLVAEVAVVAVAAEVVDIADVADVADVVADVEFMSFHPDNKTDKESRTYVNLLSYSVTLISVQSDSP